MQGVHGGSRVHGTAWGECAPRAMLYRSMCYALCSMLYPCPVAAASCCDRWTDRHGQSSGSHGTQRLALMHRPAAESCNFARGMLLSKFESGMGCSRHQSACAGGTCLLPRDAFNQAGGGCSCLGWMGSTLGRYNGRKGLLC